MQPAKTNWREGRQSETWTCVLLGRPREVWFITVAILLEKANEIARVKMAMEREDAGPIQGQACRLLLSHGPPRPLTTQNRMNNVSLFQFCHIWCCTRVGPRTGMLGPWRALLQPVRHMFAGTQRLPCTPLKLRMVNVHELLAALPSRTRSACKGTSRMLTCVTVQRACARRACEQGQACTPLWLGRFETARN